MNLRKAQRLLREPRCWRALSHGIAASLEHEHLRELCGDIRTVVDIGANKGQFALAARLLFPDAEVLSFEPLPEPAAKFRRVFDADPKVRLLPVAVGETSALMDIHVSQRDDSSSLLPITKLQDRVFPGTREIGILKIPVQPLRQSLDATQMQAPALLKLDVQGYELQALRGCEPLLGRFRFVYVELSFVELYAGQALADEVLVYLMHRGFALRGAYNLAYDGQGRAVQGDFLFEQAVPKTGTS